jgi:hypothetical protein
LRQSTSGNGRHPSASYGAGTRVGVHRSRYELERILGRYGASDFAFVEVDANASIQFAMHGRYVQLALPLPDPTDERFTQTPTGRPRTMVAQERAYEQALREHWRALVLAVRGKLQSVESGISTFDKEFAAFLVQHALEERNGKRKKKPRAVNWLLGSSHSLAIVLVAAFLVPGSGVSAFALPPSVVDHLSAPFRGALPDELGEGSGDGSRSVVLGSSGWSTGESELTVDKTFVAGSGGSETFEVESDIEAGSSGAGSVSPSEPAVEGPSAGPAQPSSGGGKSSSQSSGQTESAGAPAAPQGGGSSSGGGSGAPSPPPTAAAPPAANNGSGAPGQGGQPSGGPPAPSGEPPPGGGSASPTDPAANPDPAPENPPAPPGNGNGNGNGKDKES